MNSNKIRRSLLPSLLAAIVVSNGISSALRATEVAQIVPLNQERRAARIAQCPLAQTRDELASLVAKCAEGTAQERFRNDAMTILQSLEEDPIRISTIMEAEMWLDFARDNQTNPDIENLGDYQPILGLILQALIQGAIAILGVMMVSRTEAIALLMAPSISVASPRNLKETKGETNNES